MSVTIETEPQNFSFTSNPCVFTFSTTNSAQDAFSFYIELTVNGSVHSYHQVFTESSNYGKFDCSEVLRTIVSSDLVPSGAYQVPYTNAICTYSIRVREKYGDPPALTGSWYASNTVKAINGALRHTDWIDYDYTDYDVTTQVDKTFLMLTDFPRSETYWCGLTESMFVGAICSDTTADIVVKLYDVNDSAINADTTAITIPTNDFFVFDVSPTSIIANTTIISGDFDSCYYYEVHISATGGGAYTGNSELFRIYIDNECSQYTSRRLHWLNKFGVWDSYSFILYSEESTRIQSSDYIREKGAWDSSNDWVYNKSQGQNRSYTKTSTDVMKLNSDWIKQDKQQWLVQSLIESPIVYLEDSYNVFEPVVVNEKSFKKKQRIREGLIREELTISRTYTYTSQLG